MGMNETSKYWACPIGDCNSRCTMEVADWSYEEMAEDGRPTCGCGGEMKLVNRDNKIELIVCWDDNTWTTVIESISASIDRFDYSKVTEWITHKLWESEKYKNSVYIGIYNDNPE